MSAPSTGAAIPARQIRKLIRSASAHFTGKERGPDQGEGRRVPRRHSYDVDDPRAQPWARIGDGSVSQGLAHIEALVQAAEEMRHQSWRDQPLRAIRDARERHATLSAELQAHLDAGHAPTGRPATLRQELGRLESYLAEARDRLRRVDVTVLKAMLRGIDFATGRLFKSIDTIAAIAGCHRNAVIGALRRLRAHGFVDWVRRSIRTGNEGQFAPQREQTSNAYYFDHRVKMHRRTWARYWQILVAKLRRTGSVPPTVRPDEPPLPKDPGLRAALDRLGALIPNAST